MSSSASQNTLFQAAVLIGRIIFTGMFGMLLRTAA